MTFIRNFRNFCDFRRWPTVWAATTAAVAKDLAPGPVSGLTPEPVSGPASGPVSGLAPGLYLGLYLAKGTKKKSCRIPATPVLCLFVMVFEFYG